jgi:hypothetical protein
MRGLVLNGNLLAAGATFVRETTTGPSYLLTINWWGAPEILPYTADHCDGEVDGVFVEAP